MSRIPLQAGFTCLFSSMLALGGCERPRPASFDATVQHVQASNIAAWEGGLRGTNRWVGTPEDAMPVIDVVVPDAHADAEARIAEAAHAAVAEVNRRMAGLLLLRDVPASIGPAAHIDISYLTAHVPPAVIDDRAYCANVSEQRGQGAPFRPGPDGRRNHGIAWINVGNGHCTVETGLVVHQLARALGLDAPFPGFEARGPAAAEPMWDALAMLYASPVGTNAGNLRAAGGSMAGTAAAGEQAQPTDNPVFSGP